MENAPREIPVSDYISLDEFLKAGFLEQEAPAVIARRKQEKAFLENCIFLGLNRLSPSWDSAVIAYFDSNDFFTVLERCLSSGVEVFGVEVFTKEGLLIDINIPSGATDVSHQAFVESLSTQEGVIFSATYGLDGIKLDGPESCQSPK